MRYLIGLYFSLLLVSCKSSTTESTKTYESFSGITVTVVDSSINGFHIVEIDSSDWLINYSPLPPFPVSHSPYSEIYYSENGNKEGSNILAKVAGVSNPAYPFVVPAYPNPVADDFKIIFHNMKNADVSIILIDSTYKTVKILVQGNVNAGTTMITSNSLNIDGTKLSSGTYRCLYSWIDTITNINPPYQSIVSNISGYGDIRIK